MNPAQQQARDLAALTDPGDPHNRKPIGTSLQDLRRRKNRRKANARVKRWTQNRQ